MFIYRYKYIRIYTYKHMYLYIYVCLGGFAAAASAAAAGGTHDVVLGLVALDVVRDLDREDVVAPDRRRQVVPIYR